MKRAHYGFLALMLVLAPVAPSAQAQDGEIEPAALDVLKRATGFIASAKSLRATAEIGFDVVQESGRKLEFGMTGEITVRRPNRLRLDSERRDGTRRTLMFDGQHVTLFSPDDKDETGESWK